MVVVMFTFEYAVRLIAAPKKRSYIFSFFGLTDTKMEFIPLIF